MQKFLFHRFQGMLVCSVVLSMLILISACAGTNSGTGQTPPGTTATPSSPTQAPATPTPAPPTPTAVPATPTPAVAFKAGGISFIGPVKSVTTSSLVMSAPNGQTYTVAITPQTDRSAFGGNLPTVGTSTDMDSIINPDGSLTATIVKPAVQGDPDLNNIAYTGITSSAVGADRVIHFTAGVKNYTYTIPQTAILTDFGGNAQAIVANMTVKVKVAYPANSVVSIGNQNGG
jgi:hypothetical protein